MINLNPVDNYLHGSWEALGNGAPLLVALAQLCSERWVSGRQPTDVELQNLSGEARAILYAARNRGIVEIKAVNSAFDAAARLLAVYVELDDEHTIAFRDSKNPAITVQFLAGFRELCDCGLVVHHIYRDFSLAPAALQLARTIEREHVQSLLDKATEFGLHD
jgi:hypothetical protein